MRKGRILYVYVAILVAILVFTSRTSIGICEESSGEYHNCPAEIMKRYNLELPADCKDVIETHKFEMLLGCYIGDGDERCYFISYGYIDFTDILKPGEGFCPILPVAVAAYSIVENGKSKLVGFKYWDENDKKWYVREDDEL